MKRLILPILLTLLIAPSAFADQAATHYHRGLALKKQGKIDEAISEIKYAIQSRKDYAAAHRSLGILYRKKGAYTKAIFHLERAAKLSPKSADTYYSLGLALYRHGQKDKAIAALAKAHQLKPADEQIGLQYGVLLIRKDPEKAVPVLKKVVSLNKSSGDAMHQLGLAYRRSASVRYRKKDKKGGELAMEMAKKYLIQASAFKETAELLFDLGVLYRRLGKHHKAAAAYEKALAKKPKMAAAWWDLAHVYAQLKRPADAARGYKKFLEFSKSAKAAGLARQRIRELQKLSGSK